MTTDHIDLDAIERRPDFVQSPAVMRALVRAVRASMAAQASYKKGHCNVLLLEAEALAYAPFRKEAGDEPHTVEEEKAALRKVFRKEVGDG